MPFLFLYTVHRWIPYFKTAAIKPVSLSEINPLVDHGWSDCIFGCLVVQEFSIPHCQINIPPTIFQFYPPSFCCHVYRFGLSLTSHQYPLVTPIVSLIELDDGKIYRKTLYLMVKTMVSCRFSRKPIHWYPHCWGDSSCMNKNDFKPVESGNGCGAPPTEWMTLLESNYGTMATKTGEILW